MSQNHETPQRSVLHLTKTEADHLLRRLAGSSYLIARGVEVYAVPDEDFVLSDGSRHPGVTIMVRAETDVQVGMGHGFVTAISEGLE